MNRFSLSAHASKGDGLSRRGSSSGLRAPGSGVERRPRALIVEDHPDTREMFTWCLRACGWVVEGVGSGADALQVAPSFQPDVIVMDVSTPILDGVSASRRLKSDPETRHVPIVVVTCTGDRYEQEAWEAGCDVFLKKPVDPDVLCDLLEKLVFRADDPAGN